MTPPTETPKTLEMPELEILDSLNLDYKTQMGDPVKPAIICVDMINDFVSPDGALHVPDAMQTVEPIGNLIDEAEKSKAPVYYVCDEHYEDDPEFKIWWPHAIKNTPGAELVPPLQARFNNYGRKVPKIRIDCFFQTELEHLLNVEKVNTLIVTGTVANICVLSAAHAAGLRYFDIVVPLDCWSALEDFGYWSAAYQIQRLYKGKLVKTGNGINFA